jgi:hypothetical protein
MSRPSGRKFENQNLWLLKVENVQNLAVDPSHYQAQIRRNVSNCIFGVIFMKTVSVVALVLGAALLAGAPKAAFANSYTISDCSGGLGCGVGNNFGTVTTQNIAGGVEVSIALTPGNYFFGNFDPSVMWDLSGISSVTINGVTNYTGFAPPSGSTLTAGAVHPDGIGTFNYGIEWTGGNGDKNADPNQTLVFDLLATGLTTASFVAGTNSPTGNPLFFAFDIGTGCTTGDNGKLSCGPTGFAGATAAAVPAPVLGAGLPGLMAACAGLWAFARRRRLWLS